MRYAKLLAAAFALLLLAGCTRTVQSKPELFLFHPAGPLPSFAVVTVRPAAKLSSGGSISPYSIRRYIMDAYGAIYAVQIVGGPDWLNRDVYDIDGKVPDDLESSLQKMTPDARKQPTRAMRQSLLADRFHLKGHFETRLLPVYELVPAQGGLKITAVPAPLVRKSGTDPLEKPSPDNLLRPGSMTTIRNSNGSYTTNGHAIQMQQLVLAIGTPGVIGVGGRPIIDRTGFTSYFDIKDLNMVPLGDAMVPKITDVPSLSIALEKQLGIKLVPAKDPIEVLVIDSIDRPTPN